MPRGHTDELDSSVSINPEDLSVPEHHSIPYGDSKAHDDFEYQPLLEYQPLQPSIPDEKKWTRKPSTFVVTPVSLLDIDTEQVNIIYAK